MYNYNPFAPAHDRTRTYIAHENKIQNISKQLDLPVDDVLAAVQEVGFDVDEIEEYIRDRYNRC